jgi:hypothetical protein
VHFLQYLDIALSIAGIGTEAVIVALLFHRRIYRIVPIFCLYILWTIPSDVALIALSHHYAPQDPQYTQSYMIEMSLDFSFQFCVLVELAWAVLRPIRAALPRRTIAIISILLLLVGTAVWPVAGKLVLPGPTHQWHTLMQLQQAFAILRVLFVFVLAGFSQLLAIGWRDRELQIATGLGFYSVMCVGASILHTYHASVVQYHMVDQIVGFSYLCSLIYWIFSFAQQEAPRHSFSPKMESFLLAVSGAARADRADMEEFRRKSNDEFRRKSKKK